MPFKDRTKEASPLEVEIKKVCARLGFCFAGLELYLEAGQGSIQRAVSMAKGYPAYALMRNVLLTLFEYGATTAEKERLFTLYMTERRDFDFIRMLTRADTAEIVEEVTKFAKCRKAFSRPPKDPPMCLFDRKGISAVMKRRVTEAREKLGQVSL